MRCATRLRESRWSRFELSCITLAKEVHCDLSWQEHRATNVAWQTVTRREIRHRTVHRASGVCAVYLVVVSHGIYPLFDYVVGVERLSPRLAMNRAPVGTMHDPVGRRRYL
jgi:hypothetical protein